MSLEIARDVERWQQSRAQRDAFDIPLAVTVQSVDRSCVTINVTGARGAERRSSGTAIPVAIKTGEDGINVGVWMEGGSGWEA